MSLTLQELQQEAGACSKAKGFFDQPLNVGEQLMLICSEAAEAMEDYRNSANIEEETGGFKLTDPMFEHDGSLYGEQKTDAEIEADVTAFLHDWEVDLPKELARGNTPERLEGIKKNQLEETRKLYKPVGFGSELADVVIRVATLCERMGIDLDAFVREKLRYNRTRAFKHGGKIV